MSRRGELKTDLYRVRSLAPRSRRSYPVALVVAGLLAIGSTAPAAVAQNPVAPPVPQLEPDPTPSGPGSDYRLGPEDEIRIAVAEVRELDGEYKVGLDGRIRLPVLGEMTATGRTADEIGAEIRQILTGRFLQRSNVDVDVEVIEFRSRSVSVLGAVAKPGRHSFATDWTLLEAITAAGGLADDHGAEIHVLRRTANGLSDRLTIPVEAVFSASHPGYALPLVSGDLVQVERRRPIEVFVLGEANQAGALELASDQPVTLLFAVARMGGLPERASSKITIRRRGAGGEMREIKVNFRRILEGKDPDVELEDGDILVVKQSFF